MIAFLIDLFIGIQVIIHDQNDEPDVIDKGFFVSPGFSTFASIHKMEVNETSPKLFECLLNCIRFYHLKFYCPQLLMIRTGLFGNMVKKHNRQDHI